MEIAELPIPETMGRPRAWYAQRRLDIGPRAWAMQFGQRALSVVDQKFRADMFGVLDPTNLHFPGFRAVVFVDPASGVPTGDYTAAVMLLVAVDSNSGLLPGDVVLWRSYCDHTAMTELAPVLRGWADAWRVISPRPCTITCEINGGWESGWVALRRAELLGLDTHVGVKHTGPKSGRIETIATYAGRAAGTGKLWLRADLESEPQARRGLAQLWDWPLGAHDDFPDAVAGALDFTGMVGIRIPREPAKPAPRPWAQLPRSLS